MIKQDISVITLTLNEELHIERCIKSLLSITKKIFIIDTYTMDKTVEITKLLGTKAYLNKWLWNQDKQFHWELDNCSIKTTWAMKMDVEKYVPPGLSSEINSKLNTLNCDISGVYLKRRVYFLDNCIKQGGYYPVWLLRIWRYGHVQMEQHWMDKHIKLTSRKTVEFENDKLFRTKLEKKKLLIQKYSSLLLFVRTIIYFHYFFKLSFFNKKIIVDVSTLFANLIKKVKGTKCQ